MGASESIVFKAILQVTDITVIKVMVDITVLRVIKASIGTTVLDMSLMACSVVVVLPRLSLSPFFTVQRSVENPDCFNTILL
jgi:hypothetical protein